MRKKFLSALLLCCMVLTLLPTAALADGDVAINETNFPDSGFRKYVKENFDKDDNDRLSADEIADVKSFSVREKSIRSLEGIEHFTALESLFVESPITELDLSKNTALTELYCSGTKLTALDTSHNTKLKYLNCSENALAALDLTNNLALEKLSCGGNEFTTLDLSRNTNLKYLGFIESKLSSLDLTNNTNLEELYLFVNNLSAIDVSKNTKLKILHLYENQLITLDTSKNNNLTELKVHNNPLTSMRLGDSGSTMEVKFGNNPYPITVSTATKTFDLSQLTGFDASKASNWQGGTVSDTTLTVDEGVDNVTYTYDCGERQTTHGYPTVTGKLLMPCTLKINWKNADGPAAPVLSLVARTDKDIKVTENNTWEYSIDNGNSWQSSCLFTKLQPGTVYTIIARVKGTATQNPSENSAPLTVTTMHIEISDELGKQLRAVASGYEGKYDGMEHKAVIVDTTKMPYGWRIAGYTTDRGKNYSDSMPTIKNVGTLSVGVKFVHPDYYMNITHYYTAEVTPKPPITKITEDDLKDLEIPTLVTVKCTTTNSSREYGKIPGGFDLSKTVLSMEGDVRKATLHLNLLAYKDKYDADTNKTHEYIDLQGNLITTLTLKYVDGKWQPEGILPNLTLLVNCDGNHPQEYTITFEGNGGTPSDATMTTVNQKLPQLPKATHSGRYSFDGWYTAASGGTMIATDTEFDKNTTVYAHWTYTGSSGGSSSGRTYHTIKASSDSNGSISPSERVSVRHGRDQSFTITPNKGYEIAKVLVDGKSVGAVESYTFKSVTKNHTIEAIFMKVDDNKPMPDTFMDVPKGSYYEKAVDWAVKNGITAGTGDNYFMPDGICTRAQAVTFLWRVAGSPTPKTEVMPFEDVPEGSYYYEAVLWAAENEITVGTSATTFSPELTCSRAHIVSFLWRAAGYPSAGTVNPFADVPENAYYINAMLWAVKQEITVGTTPSTFSPDEGCTRAQIVTFLYRARSM